MTKANWIGLAAVALNLLGIGLELVWQRSVALVLAGGVMQLVAFVLTTIAIISGSWLWFSSLPLNFAAGVVWLLAQGH